jgi:hypothetical protein
MSGSRGDTLFQEQGDAAQQDEAAYKPSKRTSAEPSYQPVSQPGADNHQRQSERHQGGSRARVKPVARISGHPRHPAKQHDGAHGYAEGVPLHPQNIEIKDIERSSSAAEQRTNALKNPAAIPAAPAATAPCHRAGNTKGASAAHNA